MSETQQTAFEPKRDLPDGELHARRRLVGFERRFERLSGQMRLLADVDGVKRWAESITTGPPASSPRSATDTRS